MKQKIKIASIVFILLASFQTIWANSKTDSLITEIDLLKGEERVLQIHKVTRKYFFENPTKARDLSLEALQLSEELQNDSLIAYSYKYLGLAYYFMDYWRLSVDYYKKSMATKYGETSLHFKAALANNIAIDYEMLDEYDKSAEYYFKALKIKEPQKDSLFIAKIYLNLGLLDVKMNKNNKAIEKFEFALPIFIKENDVRNVASSYQNLFIAEFNLENVDQAKTCFNKAIKLSTDSIKTAEIYLIIAKGFLQTRDIKKH